MKKKFIPIKELKEYLVRNEISQVKFSKALGIDHVYFNSIIQGRRKASPKLTKKIEKETKNEVCANKIRPDIF